jgi:hypothetical protein
MTRLIAIAAALAFVFSASFADAKACRDAAGKFAKCPAAAAAPAKAGACRDAKGKFIKCGAPEAAAAKAGDTASPASPLTPHMNATSTAAMAAKPSPMATTAEPQAAAHPKNCKKGKACGNTCISVKDVCHK